ncbi:cuticlin-1-like [Rhodnius prolixus]
MLTTWTFIFACCAFLVDITASGDDKSGKEAPAAVAGAAKRDDSDQLALESGLPGQIATGGALPVQYHEQWPAPAPELPLITSLDVKCEKNSMKVFLGFDKPFYGIVFSKGHYSNANCVHLPAGLGRSQASFEIGIHSCGTAGNTENGLYGYGADSGSGTYFENIIVVQYDPQVQEVWDQARKLRCTWHDQYEKSVTFRPFPVDMLDVVRADFAGDNVGCWMQIQVGKGPWASEVSGLVKIGQTMTMVLAIKDDDSKFDMLVRNCVAHDGKRAPIQLVDRRGCVTRPKLMSRFTKIKNFGASASVLSYAHFQAFKFPDSMEVHFQCTIQICRYQCPEQCSEHIDHNLSDQGSIDVVHLRDERAHTWYKRQKRSLAGQEVGLNRVIKVVSTGDLTFPLDDSMNSSSTLVFPAPPTESVGVICMTTPGFAATLIVLLGILVASSLLSALLCIRLKSKMGK